MHANDLAAAVSTEQEARRKGEIAKANILAMFIRLYHAAQHAFQNLKAAGPNADPTQFEGAKQLLLDHAQQHINVIPESALGPTYHVMFRSTSPQDRVKYVSLGGALLFGKRSKLAKRNDVHLPTISPGNLHINL